MNTNLNRFALTLSGALFASTALAGGGQYPVDEVQKSAKTRAEVQAELKSTVPLIRGDVYPVLEATASQRSRAEVRAELQRARPTEPTA
ncbi:MAG: DUF4148 domain-containing protein [Burkholderiales bacterium]|jgi:hypothetical protein|nr:DUF4148 domain-containing protein [Burkholderiales bacterium]